MLIGEPVSLSLINWDDVLSPSIGSTLISRLVDAGPLLVEANNSVCDTKAKPLMPRSMLPICARIGAICGDSRSATSSKPEFVGLMEESSMPI